ncbi:hypothetical protein LOAG_09246 [Loa loa]|uniref:SH2 domain-containing protein n=1 Tax=Loa loa TaxID=7209 RepID=A0A1S0TSU0_LOALO|nr:hypothetical protein LOAG_09246 [Loa loa]EFO19248.1 hypothetical protein LOAG_09246 [Loa loa]
MRACDNTRQDLVRYYPCLFWPITAFQNYKGAMKALCRIPPLRKANDFVLIVNRKRNKRKSLRQEDTLPIRHKHRMSLVAAVTPTYDIPRPSHEAVLRLETWYHGMLTRLRSECLVRSEGDFLVRDSISFKGDYVLTVFWNGHAIHFQINKDPSPFSSSGFFFQYRGMKGLRKGLRRWGTS